MDEYVDIRRDQLGRIGPFLGIDPRLRIAEEELDDIRLPLGGGGKRIFTVDVGPDAHAGEPTTTG